MIVSWKRDLGPTGVSWRAESDGLEVGRVWPYSRTCWRGRITGAQHGFDAGHSMGEAMATLIGRLLGLQKK